MCMTSCAVVLYFYDDDTRCYTKQVYIYIYIFVYIHICVCIYIYNYENVLGALYISYNYILKLGIIHRYVYAGHSKYRELGTLLLIGY